MSLCSFQTVTAIAGFYYGFRGLMVSERCLGLGGGGGVIPVVENSECQHFQ